jgi:hypothetical protein
MANNLQHLKNLKFSFLSSDKAPTIGDITSSSKFPMDVDSSYKSLVDIPFTMDSKCVILDPIVTKQNLEIAKKIDGL